MILEAELKQPKLKPKKIKFVFWILTGNLLWLNQSDSLLSSW